MNNSQPIDQGTNQPLKPALNLRQALLTLLCPGLGQLLQKRIGVAIGFFVLFLLSGFLPVLIVSLLFRDRFSHAPLQVHLLHMSVFGGLFLIFMLVIFWAVFDAAVWKPGEKKEEKLNEKKSGFRFIELFVVIVIVSILVALLLPAVPAAREPARRMACANNLKHIGLAFQNYHDVYGSLPPAYTVDENGKPLHSWRVLLLPYLEQQGLYERIRLDEPWNSEYNKQFHNRVPTMLRCPSGGLPKLLSDKFSYLNSESNKMCHYSVVIGDETPFPGASSTCFADITDGMSNTLLVVERLSPVCWMDPNREIPFDIATKGVNRDCSGIGSAHPYRANALKADGSALCLSDLTPNARNWITKSGGDNDNW